MSYKYGHLNMSGNERKRNAKRLPTQIHRRFAWNTLKIGQKPIWVWCGWSGVGFFVWEWNGLEWVGLDGWLVRWLVVGGVAPLTTQI